MPDYEHTGVLTEEDLEPPTKEQLRRGIAIIECIQEIPCNPCVDICPTQAVTMQDINAPPNVDYDACIGCTQCVAICPGLACFVVKLEDNHAQITLPYEMLPLPMKGDIVAALNRSGHKVGEATVQNVKTGDTPIITIHVAPELALQVRAIKVEP